MGLGIGTEDAQALEIRLANTSDETRLRDRTMLSTE